MSVRLTGELYGNWVENAILFFLFHIYLLSNTKCHSGSASLLFSNTPFQFSLSSFVQRFLFWYCYCCCFCCRLNKLCSHACTLKYVFHLIPLSCCLSCRSSDWLYFDTVNSIYSFVSASSFLFSLNAWLRFFSNAFESTRNIVRRTRKKRVDYVNLLIFVFICKWEITFFTLCFAWVMPKMLCTVCLTQWKSRKSQFQYALFDRELNWLMMKEKNRTK